MKVDTIALCLVVAAVGIYVTLLLTGILTIGGPALIALLPLAIVAYLFGRLLSRRLSDREDSHYDDIER